jgi:hypothetical protein
VPQPGPIGHLSSPPTVAYTPESDQDRLGVFIAPTKAVLGLSGTVLTDESRVTHEPDVTLHELGKYIKLGLKCNPTIMELLYLPTYEVTSEIGEELISLRSSMLCEPSVRGAYGKYALSQARDLLRRHNEGTEGFTSVPRNRIAKHARHCFRLLLLGRQLLSTGTMTLDVSEHRSELFGIGELAVSDPDTFSARFESAMAEFDAARSVLPPTPAKSKLDAFLVRARLSQLH